MKLFQWITLTCTEGDILVTPSTQQKVASTAKPGIKSPCSPRVAQTVPQGKSLHLACGVFTLYSYVQQKILTLHKNCNKTTKIQLQMVTPVCPQAVVIRMLQETAELTILCETRASVFPLVSCHCEREVSPGHNQHPDYFF